MDGSENYTAKARYAETIALYNGGSYNLTKYLSSLQYTDNASDTLDSISLELDLNAMNAAGGFNPQKGEDLDIYIIMRNWYVNGKHEEYHCGNFVIDEISITGAPRVMTVKGVSQPADSELKDRQRSKAWTNVTLRQLVEEIQGKYSMPNLFFNCQDVTIEKIEQTNETDLQFLQNVCKKYGVCLKCYKTGFVLYDEAAYEARESYNFYGEYPSNAVSGSNEGYTDWTTHEIQPDYNWTTSLQGLYTGAELRYKNPKKKKETITVKVGTEEKVLYINEQVKDQSEAEKVAKARLNAQNRNATTITFKPTVFDHALFSTYNIDIRNCGMCDGKYFVDRVEITLDSGGLTQNVTARKIIQRV